SLQTTAHQSSTLFPYTTLFRSTKTDEGVIQGSCCSPILANVYAHHVIDLWFEEINQRGDRGSMRMFRYADDVVICCRHEKDAVRSEEHTSELQSLAYLVCRLLL